MVQGDYDSNTARLLIIAFNRCLGGPDNGCKTEEEINDFIKGKYLTLLSNEIRFDSAQFADAAIIK